MVLKRISVLVVLVMVAAPVAIRLLGEGRPVW